MRDALCDQICEQVRATGGTAERRPGPGVILINGNVAVRVTFSTGRVRPTWLTLWRLALGKQPTTDILIIGRIQPPDPSVFDYYVIPAYSQIRGALHVRAESGAPFLQLYKFATLQSLIEAFGRCPLPEVS
jgi:hypothetical protein